MVIDKNGLELFVDAKILVFTDDGAIREAVIVKIYDDCPTVLEAGHWLDIDFGDGPQGFVSYKVELKKD